MVGVEKGREFRFRGDLYSQESTFPLVLPVVVLQSYVLTMFLLSMFANVK